jgi:hypothetical protein
MISFFMVVFLPVDHLTRIAPSVDPGNLGARRFGLQTRGGALILKSHRPFGEAQLGSRRVMGNYDNLADVDHLVNLSPVPLLGSPPECHQRLPRAAAKLG